VISWVDRYILWLRPVDRVGRSARRDMGRR